MTDQPTNWNLYDGAILKPRRRKVFYRGRRSSDRIRSYLLVGAICLLAGFGVREFFPANANTQIAQAQSYTYASCAEARAFGAGSIRRGEPGYAAWLDDDNDGVACEPLPQRQ